MGTKAVETTATKRPRSRGQRCEVILFEDSVAALESLRRHLEAASPTHEPVSEGAAVRFALKRAARAVERSSAAGRS